MTELLELFKVAPVNSAVLLSALSLRFSDFEDAVIHEAARAVSAGVIVTRDQTGFRSGQLLAMPPDQLLAVLGQAG